MSRTDMFLGHGTVVQYILHYTHTHGHWVNPNKSKNFRVLFHFMNKSYMVLGGRRRKELGVVAVVSDPVAHV